VGHVIHGRRFPFSLPHFELVRRCHQAPSRAEHWVAPSRTQPERRALRHLASLLARLDRGERIPATVKLLESLWQAFSELRDVLRLTNADLPGNVRHRALRKPGKVVCPGYHLPGDVGLTFAVVRLCRSCVGNVGEEAA
jgi:hypothetical protein